MVRLKVSNRAGKPYMPSKFQFQDGAIKRMMLIPLSVFYFSFQFQDGAIKRDLSVKT